MSYIAHTLFTIIEKYPSSEVDSGYGPRIWESVCVPISDAEIAFPNSMA